MNPGPLTVALASMSEKDRRETKRNLAATFSTPEGRNVMKLLTQFVSLATLPAGLTDGAYREMEAQRRLIAEIRDHSKLE